MGVRPPRLQAPAMAESDPLMPTVAAWDHAGGEIKGSSFNG
jgi:hypothetical protein